MSKVCNKTGLTTAAAAVLGQDEAVVIVWRVRRRARRLTLWSVCMSTRKAVRPVGLQGPGLSKCPSTLCCDGNTGGA